MLSHKNRSVVKDCHKVKTLIDELNQSAPPPALAPGACDSEFIPLFDTHLKSGGFRITRLSLKNDELSLVAGVDYLRIVAYPSTLDSLKDAVAQLTNTDKESIQFTQDGWGAGGKAKKYDFGLVSPDGITKGGYTFYDDDDDNVEFSYYELCLQFSGEYFLDKDLDAQYKFLRNCRRLGFGKCLRMDLKIDDFSFQIIPYQEMWEASISGNTMYLSKCESVRKFRNGELREYGNYNGSRDSGVFLRTYVHTWGDNEYHSMRLEAEFKSKNGYAQAVYETLSEFYEGADFPEWGKLVRNAEKASEEGLTPIYYTQERNDFSQVELSQESLFNFGKLMSHILVGVIDFRDKSVFSDKSKASVRDSERLEFWQKFLDVIGGSLKLKIEGKVPRSLPRSLRWLFESVSPLFSVCYHGLGNDLFRPFLNILIEFGLQKAKNYHFEQINLLMRHPNLIYDLASDQLPF